MSINNMWWCDNNNNKNNNDKPNIKTHNRWQQKNRHGSRERKRCDKQRQLF